MDMVERYLQAVRHSLPVANRDDLVAELGEDVRSDIREREADAGRPLHAPEMQALLQRRGHPVWVASRYLPQQWLIGPALLPVYRRVVLASVACLLAIFAASWAAFAMVPAEPARAALARPGFWLGQAVLWGFAYGGALTLLFALIERRHNGIKAGDAWDPHRPYALPSSPEQEAAAEAARARVAAAARLAGGTLFTAWWLGALHVAPVPEVAVQPAQVWQILWWPILLLAVAAIALDAASVVRPRPSRLRTLCTLVRDVAVIGVVAVLLGAGSLVEVAVPGTPAERLARFQWAVNLALLVTVGVVGLSHLAGALREGRTVLRTSRR